MKLEVLVIPVSDVDRTSDIETAHDELVRRGIEVSDPDWPDWYSAYMVAELAGTELPT